MYHLNLEEKVYLIIGCAGLVTLTGLAVICYLEYVKWRDRQEQESTAWPEPVQLRHFSIPSDSTSLSCSDSLKSSRDSGRLSLDSSVPFSTDSRKSSVQSQVHQPHINLILQPDPDGGRLTVNVENAVDLPGRIYTDRCDPSVSVRLERIRRRSLADSFRLRDGGQSAQLLAETSFTPLRQHSLHPIFKHTAVFHIDHLSLRECHLVVTVEDNDRLTGPSEFGHVRISLREALDAESPSGEEQRPEAIQVSRPLHSPDPVEKGDILVAISFLPTSQRILVQIEQCRHLAIDSSTACMVRLYLLDSSGRVSKRRKTSVRPQSDRIRFDESFNFDVTVDRWDRTAVLMVVNCLVTERDGSVTGRPVGHAALGKYVTPNGGQIHWNSASQNPRKLISLWHSLH